MQARKVKATSNMESHPESGPNADLHPGNCIDAISGLSRVVMGGGGGFLHKESYSGLRLAASSHFTVADSLHTIAQNQERHFPQSNIVIC